MLKRLRLSQYALIDEAEVEFGPGLNVLTGETGAGKSILVEGLALLLGARAATEMIRHGAERAEIEGLFEEHGEETLVRRDLFRDRSNRCSVDGRLATVRMLQEEGGARVELHGQHEDVLLLKRSVQRDLLDAWAGAGELAARVAAAAAALAALEEERTALARQAEERAARADYLRSQVEEIDAAGLQPGEEEELEAASLRLRNSAERQRLAGEVHERLEGAEAALGPALAVLERTLSRLAGLDSAAAAWATRLAGARYELEELARELLDYAEGVEHDAARLAGIEERRDALYRLGRKHGAATAVEVIERGETMRSELAGLDAAGARAGSLDAEIGARRSELERAAGALSDAREAASDRLEAAVGERLAELGMGGGGFRVAFERRPDEAGLEWAGGRWAWTRAGFEEVQFRIEPNPGEGLRPLSQIASGGELSRILLALKAALAAADRTPTLVFDEIDAGIGGVVAHHVARQLKTVARHHQVVVVTHLAQIAAAADRHLVVEKAERGDRVVTTVRSVEGEERVREVSRLLGGDPERVVSRHHAEELLAGR
ncbi:MAG TPA: DNA repair protein RecN [Gemmatimonadota bacterium]|nr:DNA repair protein RecN [Gemmatimonadota bacterium]